MLQLDASEHHMQKLVRGLGCFAGGTQLGLEGWVLGRCMNFGAQPGLLLSRLLGVYACCGEVEMWFGWGCCLDHCGFGLSSRCLALVCWGGVRRAWHAAQLMEL